MILCLHHYGDLMTAKIKTKSPYSKMIYSSKRLIIRPYKMTGLSLCREAKEKRLKKINKFDDEVPEFWNITYF